jgi:hypothetical protein
MRAALLVLVATAAAGCKLDAYSCTSDGQCVIQGVAGRCVQASLTARYCAFYDPSCKSRLRFDDSAASPYTGVCTAVVDMGVTPPADLADFAEPPEEDMTPVKTEPCPPSDPGCRHVEVTPPFSLVRDPMPNPAESDTGLDRNSDGQLVLGHLGGAPSTSVWTTSLTDFQNRGSVSKFDVAKVREVARYSPVTCYSLKSGSAGMCDGQNGCCAIDDNARYLARRAGKQPPDHQAVQPTLNAPTEIAIDLDGNAFVSNRGTPQSSVTRIAGDRSLCVDRNHNGVIDTSSDTNGDGLIQEDCNGDGQPDDIASVKKAPCSNGLSQEFYGPDDECLLWTANVDAANTFHRALALGLVSATTSAVDAWTVSQSGHVIRVDGTTGLAKDDGMLPNGCFAAAVTIDPSGIGWTSGQGQPAGCLFDTRALGNSDRVRQPNTGNFFGGGGVTVDRDQNVWFSSLSTAEVYRYTPLRDRVFQHLGSMGRWVRVYNLGGGGGQGFSHGVAADNRTPTQYFVWSTLTNGSLVRVPGAQLDTLVPGKSDGSLDGSGFPSVHVAQQAIAVGLDADQNLWSVSSSPASVTRVKVNASGTPSPPTLGFPVGKNKCPATDYCPLIDGNVVPFPDMDSDFTGFALRNFGRARGVYSWIQPGCKNVGGFPAPTEWIQSTWDGLVPVGAALMVRARTGDTPTPDLTWGPWTASVSASPLDLKAALPNNDTGDGYLQVEFTLVSTNTTTTPVLRSFAFDFRCK